MLFKYEVTSAPTSKSVKKLERKLGKALKPGVLPEKFFSELSDIDGVHVLHIPCPETYNVYINYATPQKTDDTWSCKLTGFTVSKEQYQVIKTILDKYPVAGDDLSKLTANYPLVQSILEKQGIADRNMLCNPIINLQSSEKFSYMLQLFPKKM